MNERRLGWIGLLESRPALCLVIVGAVLSALSLCDLLFLRFGWSSRMIRRGIFGWPSCRPIPLPFPFVAGIVGLASGTVMLIFVLAHRHRRPARARLFGCALIGDGVMWTAVGLYPGSTVHRPELCL